MKRLSQLPMFSVKQTALKCAPTYPARETVSLVAMPGTAANVTSDASELRTERPSLHSTCL